MDHLANHSHDVGCHAQNVLVVEVAAEPVPVPEHFDPFSTSQAMNGTGHTDGAALHSAIVLMIDDYVT
jgi:hypothetical protein